MDPVDCFPSRYQEARSRFVEAAKAAGATVTSYAHPLTGPDGEALAIDVAWLGRPDAEDVVFVVSGTHGVEGFAGSGCQTAWLESRATSLRDIDGPAICLLHALNPWGFAHLRRVNEDNVDLNRNFVDFDVPLPANPGYVEIADLLVPETWDEDSQAATGQALAGHVERRSLRWLQEAITAGQYTHPDGMYFGGTAPTWSRRTLEQIENDLLSTAARVAVLDLHTGLGEKGTCELISSEPAGSAGYDRAVRRYGETVTSAASGTSISPEVSGDWLVSIDRTLPGEVTAVCLEWGTHNAVHVLNAMRADHWLHKHGDPTDPAAVAIRAGARDAFYCDDATWKQQVWDRFDTEMARTIG